MDNFNVYRDIQARTGGEIYIGVVGPVRTGKSTFIKRFMELLVLPTMEDEHMRTVRWTVWALWLMGRLAMWKTGKSGW